MMTGRFVAAVLVCALAVVGCRRAEAPGTGEAGDTGSVTEFLTDANARLLKLINEANEAGWVLQTYITSDTQALSARADEAYVSASTDYAKRAARFPADVGTPEERRQLTVLKNTMTMAAPADPKKTTELTTISSRMAAAYGSRQVLPAGCEGLGGLPRRGSRDEDHGGEPRPEAPARSVGRLAQHRAGDEAGLCALRRAVERGREGSRVSRTPARCGARVTTCRRTRSRRSWIGCGSSCSRSICRCTPTSAPDSARSTATTCRPRADSGLSAWQHLGAGLVERLRPRGAARHDAEPFRSTPSSSSARRSRWRWRGSAERFFTSLGFDPLPKTF